MFEYELDKLVSVPDDVINSEAKVSHKIKRVMLADSPRSWVCKEIADPALARLELLAQEFFRLIISHQPETRLARDPVLNTYYILSEEVEGYKPLPYDEPSNFLNGTNTGLGQAMLVSMFLEEIDLKNGNIGLDAQNQVIKIDGDRCFACRRDKYKDNDFKLTHFSIGFLPYASGFYAYNWLDLVQEGTSMPDSRIVCPSLSRSEQFRAEVNQAIFKICCLPEHFIECFVDSYIIAGGQEFIDLLKSRRNNLLQGALENKSFLEYLNTNKCHDDLQAITQQMKDFSVRQQEVVYSQSNHKRLESDIKQLQEILHMPPEKLKVKPQQLNKAIISKPQPKLKKSMISKALSFFGGGKKAKAQNRLSKKDKSPGLGNLKMAKKIEMRSRSSDHTVFPETQLPHMKIDDGCKEGIDDEQKERCDVSNELKNGF